MTHCTHCNETNQPLCTFDKFSLHTEGRMLLSACVVYMYSSLSACVVHMYLLPIKATDPDASTQLSSPASCSEIFPLSSCEFISQQHHCIIFAQVNSCLCGTQGCLNGRQFTHNCWVVLKKQTLRSYACNAWECLSRLLAESDNSPLQKI